MYSMHDIVFFCICEYYIVDCQSSLDLVSLPYTLTFRKNCAGKIAVKIIGILISRYSIIIGDIN